MNRRRALGAAAACLALAGCAVSANRASGAGSHREVAVAQQVVATQSGDERAAQTDRLLPQYRRPFAELINRLDCPRIDADSQSARCTNQGGTIEIDFGSYAAELISHGTRPSNWWIFVAGKRDGQQWVAQCTCEPASLAPLGGKRLR